ncbi:TonB-dependent receptor plug domain-containing protein [Winogradskyella litorisediminis]|uniref:TonB-dependent receptor plug domain-containing protein n=1 Tax=Winogradskyella litorisediminis TaxID=1156618 RepID=UPI0036DCC130
MLLFLKVNSFKRNILYFIVGFSMCCFSQSNKAKIPLKTILKSVEETFNVRISFADETIETISILPPNQNFTLQQTLDDISKKTGLIFNVLNERFIALEKPKTNDLSNVKLQRLDEVFVQNYLTKGISKSIDGTIEISPQKFGILPGLSEPDILQTIQTLPGITSVDERISNINIRGGTNDQNLILYEGIRMYQTGHFFGLISAFNPYLTQNVNVSLNGTRTKYGSGVSSLISINNDDNITEKTKSGAGFNLLSVDGYSSFKLSDKMGLQVSARRSYTDALLTPTYDNYLERIFNNSQLSNNNSPQQQLQQNESFFFYDASLKFLYDIDKKSKLRVNAITIFNQLDYSANDDFNQGTTSNLSQKSYAANVTYDRRINKSTEFNTQIYFSNYQLFGSNVINQSNQSLTQENVVNDFGLRANFLKSVDNHLSINYGYQFNDISVSDLEDVSNPNFRRFERNVLSTHGVYGEAEFTSVSKNTYGRVGLRGNYIGKLDALLFEPRFSFSQKFLSYFKFEILGEIKSQSITQFIDLQQDFFGIEKRRWQLSNGNDVPILKSNQFSVGINYKNNGLLVSAEAYTKKVSGISAESQGFQNQFQFVNADGDYAIKGIDFLFNKQFKNFSTWFSYSFSKNNYRFQSLNNNEEFPNNIDIQHVINISSAYVLDNLKISAGLNWHSGRPFTEPSENQFNSGTILYKSPNDERIEDYMRLDISANYNFEVAKNVNGEVGFSILNVFDEDNTINRFFTRNGTEPIVQNNESALGFNPNFSFRLKF